MLFKDTKFIIISYSNNRKWIQKSVQFKECHLNFNWDKICAPKFHFVIYLLCEFGSTTFPLWSIPSTVICTQDLFPNTCPQICLMCIWLSKLRIFWIHLNTWLRLSLVKFSFLRIWGWAWERAINTDLSPETEE